MTDHADISWRVQELERRVTQLENLQPAVIAERVSMLTAEVHGLKRAFWAVALAIVTSSITFAFVTLTAFN